MHNLDLVPSKLEAATCPAEVLLSRALANLSQGFTQLEAFRIPVLAGLESGLSVLEARYRTFMEGLFRQIQLPKVPEVFDATFSSVFTPAKRIAATQAIDSASLVFAHALFEATVHTLLDIARLVRQRALLGRLRSRAIPVSAYVDGSVDEFIGSLLNGHISELKRRSLHDKLSVLLSLFRCRSAFDHPQVPVNIERITAIDRLRQDLLHGAVLGRALPTAADDCDFLYSAGNFYIAVVATSAALEASYSEALVALTQPRGAA